MKSKSLIVSPLLILTVLPVLAAESNKKTFLTAKETLGIAKDSGKTAYYAALTGFSGVACLLTANATLKTIAEARKDFDSDISPYNNISDDLFGEDGKGHTVNILLGTYLTGLALHATVYFAKKTHEAHLATKEAVTSFRKNKWWHDLTFPTIFKSA